MQDKRGAISRRALLLGRFSGMQGEDLATREALPDLQSANLAFERGEWSEAASLYRRHLRQNPDNGEPRQRLGRCLYSLGQYVQARVEFERVLRRKKMDNQAILFLGLCHARLGRTDRAAELWRSYCDPSVLAVQREVNVQLALLEAGRASEGAAMAAAVEEAVARAEA